MGNFRLKNTCNVFIGWQINIQSIRIIFWPGHKLLSRKQTKYLDVTWNSLPNENGKYCGKYCERQIAHFSPPSSPVQPPAGSPLVAGREKHRGTGEDRGRRPRLGPKDRGGLGSPTRCENRWNLQNRSNMNLFLGEMPKPLIPT